MVIRKKSSLNYGDYLIRSEFKELFNALPFYVFLVDEQHYILFANKAVKKHLRVELKKILGQYCPKVIHGLNEPYPGCPLEGAASSGQSVEKEFFDRDTGRWITSAVFPTRLATAAGRKIFVHFVQDITDRKQAEQIRQETMLMERNRIATELHDDCAQDLAYMIKSLELCEKFCRGDKSLAELEKLKQNTAKVLSNIRQVIYDLKSAGVAEQTLEDRLTAYLKTTGLKIRTNITRIVTNVSPEHAKILFNIVKEAIANIRKHSGAKIAKLMVKKKAGRLFIKIADRGKGFDLKRSQVLAVSKGNWGLLNMQQGAISLGGDLQISSAPGRGTRISLTIPLNNLNNRKQNRCRKK